MRLAHLADVHLGFRQYHRLTSQGINQREADVAAAFRAAIDGVIEAAPDLVVVAGDLFHSVRPTNPAILHSFNQFRRLRAALPQTPIVLVAGNHDAPRSLETGTILKLFEALDRVHVVTDEPRDIAFEDLDTSVTCVPHSAWRSGDRPRLLPKAGHAFNVVVTHCEVAGVLPSRSWSIEYGGAIVEPAELHADRWDYVALGHFHVAHQVRENAWYAGALEYASPNPWGELQDEARVGRAGQKGWLLVELGDGPARVEFQPIALARQLYDLEPIHATGLVAEDVDRGIEEAVASIRGGMDDQIVRLVVYDVPRPVARDLDHARIRELKAKALHFHLDLRRPAPHREVGVGTPGTRTTLSDILTDYLSRRPLDDTVDRESLVVLGRQYMDQVDRAEVES